MEEGLGVEEVARNVRGTFLEHLLLGLFKP
jgi:hypothetical protein